MDTPDKYKPDYIACRSVFQNRHRARPHTRVPVGVLDDAVQEGDTYTLRPVDDRTLIVEEGDHGEITADTWIKEYNNHVVFIPAEVWDHMDVEPGDYIVFRRTDDDGVFRGDVQDTHPDS